MAKRKGKATGGALESDTHGGYTTERSSLPPAGGPQARFAKGGQVGRPKHGHHKGSVARAHKAKGGGLKLADSQIGTRPASRMIMNSKPSADPGTGDMAPRGFAKGGQIQKW